MSITSINAINSEHLFYLIYYLSIEYRTLNSNAKFLQTGSAEICLNKRVEYKNHNSSHGTVAMTPLVFLPDEANEVIVAVSLDNPHFQFK